MYEPSMLRAAMDTRAGRIVVLQPRPTVVEVPVTWTFDVCRNSWQRMQATLAPDADVWQLVYHEAADLTLAIPGWEGPIRGYSYGDDAWTDIPTRGRQPARISDAVYDPDTGTVIGWSDPSASLWSYDLARRTWTPFAHRPGDTWPDLTSATLDDWTGYTLLAYDTVRDAVLLAVFPVDGRRGGTWSFDVGTGRWTDLRSPPPALLFGYAELGTEMAYDSAHGRAVAITAARSSSSTAAAALGRVRRLRRGATPSSSTPRGLPGPSTGCSSCPTACHWDSSPEVSTRRSSTPRTSGSSSSAATRACATDGFRSTSRSAGGSPRTRGPTTSRAMPGPSWSPSRSRWSWRARTAPAGTRPPR